MSARFVVGDVFDRLAELPDGSVDLVLTSPPFLALRSYLPADHPSKGQEIGSEARPAEYLDVLLQLTAEWGRVLAPHGSIAVELGDTYAGSGGAGGDYNPEGLRDGQQAFTGSGSAERISRKYGRVQGDGQAHPIINRNGKTQGGGTGWPLEKSLTGIPTLYAWSLAYGRNLLTGEESPAGQWRVRNVKPWIRCLDIDTAIYVRTPTGDRPMRLLHLHQQFAPDKFKVWNGERWTPVVATQPSTADDAIEVEFRTGERITCTREHRWPVESILGTTKVLRANELTVGDVVPQVRLPGPERVEPSGLPDDDIGWFVGVYLGDGSFDSKDRIQIAGHKVLDAERGRRLERIAADYDGTSSIYEHGNEDGGNSGNVVVRSKALTAVVRQYIGGKNARSKHLSPAAWRRSDAFLRSLLMGYLESDGHYDEKNDRWRLGFTDNPWLARDLRTLAARLGASCIIKRWRAGVDPRGGHWAGAMTHRHRGEIRFTHRSFTPASRGEVVAIRQTKRRTFIDVAVADDPHLFALASGLLTHNSNPPVGALGDKDRPATSYVIVATRARDRYFDLDAVRTPSDYHRESLYTNASTSPGQRPNTSQHTTHPAGAPPRDWWHHVDAVLDACLDGMAGRPERISERSSPKTGAEGRGGGWSTLAETGVNRQTGTRGHHLRRALEAAGILTTADAMDISPKGYAGSHYAVWPPELCRLLIDEMCPRRVCVTCGKPSRRETDSTQRDTGRRTNGAKNLGRKAESPTDYPTRTVAEHTTTGWSSCGCPGTYGLKLDGFHTGAGWRPGVVLDPFVGSGTTLAVASGMGRDSVGIDLDPRNADLARERVGMFLTVDEGSLFDGGSAA